MLVKFTNWSNFFYFVYLILIIHQNNFISKPKTKFFYINVKCI